MDANSLFYSILFSMIGIGYFGYGKKNNIYFMVSGIILMLFTYVVGDVTWEIIIGTTLVILPFILNWLVPL